MSRSLRSLVALAVLSLAFPIVAPAQEVRLLTDLRTGERGSPSIDDAGATVVAASSADPSGANPRHAWELFAWDAASGAVSQLSAFREGVLRDAVSVSVSDAGDWIAFVSRGNLTGQNHDGSLELFVTTPSGAGLAQVTSDPSVAAGTVGYAVLSGSGDRVAFVADTDPLGTNPSRVNQVFVVNRDGTGLVQLTALSTAASGWSLHPWISDDGGRVVYASSSNPVGGNADGSSEIFAVGADGTGTRQLTAGTGGGSDGPVISGDGSRVAFGSWADLLGSNPSLVEQVFVVDWSGTNLRQLTAVADTSWAESPSITDDGLTVFYDSDESSATVNPDANPEIWKIRADGTSKTLLTETPGGYGSTGPVASGSGSRVVFSTTGEFPGGSNPDHGLELVAMSGTGTGLVQLSSGAKGWSQEPDLTPDGARVVFSGVRDLSAPAPRYEQIFRIQADGTGLAQVTSLSDGGATHPGVTSDGSTIVFTSTANPVSQNADHGQEVFAIDADGTNLRQISADPSMSWWSWHPVVSGNGLYVVFQSSGNIGGTNPLHSPELIRVKPDGTSPLRLTLDRSDWYKLPRIDDNGTWVVYQSRGNPVSQNTDGGVEVFRIKTDGTGLQQVTSSPTYWAVEPDVSASGARIVYASDGDPLGTNADHNYEIFSYDPATTTRRQLTSTTSGSSGWPRISGDGAWVYFESTAPFFESIPDRPTELYRVAVATGVVERADGLRIPGTGVGGGSYKDYPYTYAASSDGSRVAFAAGGSWGGGNEDGSDEVWLSDQAARTGIAVGKASPTVVSWTVEPKPRRYDVIRGDVASLHAGAGGIVDLGAVSCVEDDSPDADTLGSEDPEAPPPGHAFFYLVRGSQGLLDGPGSYGQGTSGGERIPASGGCGG